MSEAIQIGIASSVATLVISWGSLYLSHRLELARQIRLREGEARVRTYASIVGQRLVLSQLYVSRFEAFIFSDYHDARWRLAGHPNDSLDLQEAQRWMHKSEDLALDVAKANRELFEAVASARALFPESPKLEELADAVYRHSVPVISVRPDADMKASKLEAWKVKAVQEIQDLVATAVERPVDDLVEHISHYVRSGA